MVENIEHLHEGKKPFQAAIDAARELVGPIIAMSITLAAVYVPVALQGGLTGTLFREFAFTLSGAVIISGIVALTLSPMMGSKLLRSGDTARGFAGVINRTFEKVLRFYGRVLTRTLAYRPVVLVLWVLVILLIFPFYMLSQKELAPTEDQNVVFGIVQAAPNSTLEQTQLFSQQVHDAFRSIPETGHIFQITFATGGFGGMGQALEFQRRSLRNQQQMYEAMPAGQTCGRLEDLLISTGRTSTGVATCRPTAL
jgi:multidrug efflux pump